MGANGEPGTGNVGAGGAPGCSVATEELPHQWPVSNMEPERPPPAATAAALIDIL